jgi:hypothetical protein
LFITRVETVDGLIHVKVYAKGTPAKLMAWCACPDSDQGRAAARVLADVADGLANHTEPALVSRLPMGR